MDWGLAPSGSTPDRGAVIDIVFKPYDRRAAVSITAAPHRVNLLRIPHYYRSSRSANSDSNPATLNCGNEQR